MAEPLTKDKIIEKLSDLEHEQWMYWSKAVYYKYKELYGDNDLMVKEMWDRWSPNWHPYAELPEQTKEHDRKWARKAYEEFEKDLKSALEEFERLCKEDISDKRGFSESTKHYAGKQQGLIFALDNVKKAFPAIYDKENGDKV